MQVWLKALGVVAGLLGAAGVALAAAGAHLTDKPSVTIAAHFMLFHAAALLALCAAAKPHPTRTILIAATAMATGTILFSGDLAIRGLAEIVLVHKAAPIGGTILIVSWLMAAFAAPSALSVDR